MLLIWFYKTKIIKISDIAKLILDFHLFFVILQQNNRNMRKTILLIFMLCSIVTQAQTLQQMGGVYYAYHFDENWQELKAPRGYKPFYISHYGRHGSRWMPSDERYIWVNSQFEDETNLTPLGKKVKQLLAEVWANAQGYGGKLTRLGERQHRGIARRMVENFPEVFTDGTRVKARSSVVDRCAKSMLAFVAEMWAMQSSLDVDVRTDSADAFVDRLTK